MGSFKGQTFILEERYVREIDSLLPAVRRADLEIFGIPTANKDERGNIVGVNESLDGAAFKQVKVNVRLYVVDAEIYEEMDIGSEPDPYLVIKLGNQVRDDSKSRIDDQKAPKFYKMYQFEHMLPGAGTLQITMMDYDPLKSDEIIGTTEIDIEARFFDPVYRNLPLYPIETRSLTRGDNQQALGTIRLWVEVFDPAQVAKAADEYSTKLQNLKASSAFGLPKHSATLLPQTGELPAPVRTSTVVLSDAEVEDQLKIDGMSRKIWNIGLMPPEDLELRVVVWRVDDCPREDYEDVSDLYVTVGMPNLRDGVTKKTDTHIRSTGFVRAVTDSGELQLEDEVPSQSRLLHTTRVLHTGRPALGQRHLVQGRLHLECELLGLGVHQGVHHQWVSVCPQNRRCV